jgi:hypothetical protein
VRLGAFGRDLDDPNVGMVGGEDSEVAALAAGRGIGGEVLSHALLLRMRLPTDNGNCPR